MQTMPLSAAQGDNVTIIKGDICNLDMVMDVLLKHDIDTIVHFARWAAVRSRPRGGGTGSTGRPACVELGGQVGLLLRRRCTPVHNRQRLVAAA